MAKEKDPNPPVEKIISLSGIQTMKKAEIIKEFKALKSFWMTKANAVIFLLAFSKNADKKKVSIAIPYKKDTDMRPEFKEIKAKKIHSMQKTAAGLFSLDKEKKEVTITLTNGGVKEEDLLKMGGKLFGLLKWTLKIKLAADFEGEKPDPNEVVEADEDDEEAYSAEEAAEVESAEEEQEDMDLIAKIKSNLIEVADKMKTKVQAVVMNNIRAKTAGEDDLESVDALRKQIDVLKKMYEGATATIKNAFAKNVEGILAYVPSLSKIKSAIEDLLTGSSSGDTAEDDAEKSKAEKELQKQWEALQKDMEKMTSSISDTVDALKKAAGETLKSGKDLLQQLQ